jgi:hypothetical protein
MVTAVHPTVVYVLILLNGMEHIVIFLFAISRVQMVAIVQIQTIALVHLNGLISIATPVCIVVVG